MIFSHLIYLSCGIPCNLLSNFLQQLYSSSLSVLYVKYFKKWSICSWAQKLCDRFHFPQQMIGAGFQWLTAALMPQAIGMLEFSEEIKNVFSLGRSICRYHACCHDPATLVILLSAFGNLILIKWKKILHMFKSVMKAQILKERRCLQIQVPTWIDEVICTPYNY